MQEVHNSVGGGIRWGLADDLSGEYEVDDQQEYVDVNSCLSAHLGYGFVAKAERYGKAAEYGEDVEILFYKVDEIVGAGEMAVGDCGWHVAGVIPRCSLRLLPALPRR